MSKSKVGRLLNTIGPVVLVLLPGFAFGAGSVEPGLDGITEKLEQIRNLCTAAAVIIVGIGAIWCGLKFVKGDQDAWGYIWKFGLGAILVFSAGNIVTWLGGR